MSSSLSRRLFRDFAVYGGGEIALRATGFVMLPIYTRLLAADEYGAWGFMTTAVGLLSALLVLGGDTAYSRFFFEAKTHEERQTLASTWFLFLGIWTAACSLLLALFSRPIAAWFLHHHSYGLALAFAILSTPLTVMNILLGEVLRNEFRALTYTVLNVAGAILLIGMTLLFVVGLHKELTGLAFGTDAALAAMLPIRLWTVRGHLRIRFSTPLLRRMIRFGAPLVPISIAYWVFAVSDRIVLAKLSTLHALGLYTVAGAVTAGLALIQAALARALGPHAIRMYEHAPEDARRALGRLLVYVVVAFGAVCVATSAFAHELLIALATPGYYGAAAAVGPLALGALFYATTQVTSLPMTFVKQTGHLSRIAALAAIVNLGLNLALVPAFGMLASAWATAAAYLLLTAGYAIVGQRLWRIDYDIRSTITAVVLAAVLIPTARVLPDVSSGLTLGTKIAYVLLYGALLLATGVVRRSDFARLRVLGESRT